MKDYRKQKRAKVRSLEMIVANLEKEKDEKDTGGENDQNKNK
jgi:hypothetical protein